MVGKGAKLPLIILAEDDPDDRLLLREAFVETGVAAELLMVTDGEALLDCLCGRGEHAQAMEGRMPALVICDINMPRLSGFEALHAVRALRHLDQVPVVMLTSSHRAEDRARSLDLGASAHRVKPASYSELLALLRDVLRAHLGDASGAGS